MDNRPVAVLDSGFGGLTAVTALRKLLPNENIVFFADQGRVPYGTRSRNEIRRFMRQDIDFALSQNAKAVLVACGTLSVNGPDIMQECPVKCIGVAIPAVEAVAADSGGAPVGIIATESSINGGFYESLIREFIPDRNLISKATQEFVTLVENGHFSADDPLVMASVKKNLGELKEAGISILLEGCTHFGLLTEAFERFFGAGVCLLNASECAAETLAKWLKVNDMCAETCGEVYYTSGSKEAFTKLGSVFTGRDISGYVYQLPVWEA